MRLNGYARVGMEQTAKQEYQDFAARNSNHAALGAAAKHRQNAQRFMSKGGPWAKAGQAELAKAQALEGANTANVNRAYIQHSIGKLNNQLNDGFAGNDGWAAASFQARMKAAYADFNATGGSGGEFQQRVMAGIQNPYFRSVLIGHPGLL